jgi:hypothetical protein
MNINSKERENTANSTWTKPKTSDLYVLNWKSIGNRLRGYIENRQGI